jgi:hypothetical protein
MTVFCGHRADSNKYSPKVSELFQMYVLQNYVCRMTNSQWVKEIYQNKDPTFTSLLLNLNIKYNLSSRERKKKINPMISFMI